MKVFVEDTEGKLFLTEAQTWTPLQEQARDFKNTRAARAAGSQHPDRQLCVYLAFNNPRFDTRLPLNRLRETDRGSSSE